jgi:ATP-dependent exoDNAse (exonuclease V) beta subunit
VSAAVQQSFDDLDEDLATRAAIVDALDETLFVEAGAGSGKTKALVDRIVALVVQRDVPMREIAAVTFTEKAAAELRDRIRRALEPLAGEGDTVTAARATLALEELDAAAVSTLHAFAQRILAEHPVEAGLPPRVQVLDDIASQLAFEERWTRFVDELLEDPALERTVLLALNADTTLTVLRTLALACNANWDLVAERMGPEPDPPSLAPRLEPLLGSLAQLRTRAPRCLDPDDKLLEKVVDLAAWHDALLAAPDEYEQMRMLTLGAPTGNLRHGKKTNWPDDCSADDVRAEIGAIRARVTELSHALSEAVVRRLAWELARFTLREAAARRAAGELEFHDLLVLARAMLRDPEHGWEVRQRLRARYTRLLLDEFQDTDPIQCDLAALIASGEPDARAHRWDELPVDPGRLFVVGDPKQSIYRFRRADIAAFLRARSAFGASPRRLTRNFRTSAPVIDVVNEIFRELIVAEPESQPEYVALEPVRDPVPVGPAVVLLGTEPDAELTTADDLREREASDVAAVVRRALREGWTVMRRASGPDGAADGGGREHPEPCRLGDLCILLPARTSLGHLEDALDAAGIPYRAETSSLVYSTREIRDLLVALQAVDDPTDELALVAALRSPIFGCGDDDLYTYRVEHGGPWDHQRPRPETLPAGHPVGDAMDALAAWHEARHWSSPSELLERIVRERRVLEVGFAHGRPRDLWRRVRFVVEQARAFADAEGGSVRDFLAWADLQGSEGARVVETVLPETDDDAVRILTIHGAKGLEFPITIVSGMTTRAQARVAGVQLRFPHDRDTYALRVSSRVTTEEFERYAPIDEQMDFHEKLRLLYVAMTRARDHLVVSVCRPAKEPGPDRTSWTHAQLVWDAAAGQPGWEPFVAASEDLAVLRPTDTTTPATGAPPPWDDWRAARDEARSAAMRRRVVSATALARDAEVGTPVPDPGLAKGPRDLELPPWNKGRYGTALGRAVHAVLQTVDLATGAGLDDAAAAQAAAEGIVGREDAVAARARLALTTRVVQEAVAHGFHREMYVATPVDGTTLEGYVDLVYRRPDGLVVVDYKTDAWSDDAELAAKVARYRLQGAAYAVALEQATGAPVAECVFVFLGGRVAEEVTVSDLPGAMRDARAALAGSSAGATTRALPRPVR